MSAEPNDSPKLRTIAFWLAMPLGAFGAHRFYVGRSGSATVQLILSCTIVGLVITVPWAFIDLFAIFLGKFRDKDGLLVTKWA